MEQKYRKIKAKVLLSITLLYVVILVLFISFEINNYNKLINVKLESETKSLKTLLQNELDKLDKFYFTRIACNIHSEAILNAISSHDRNTLYKLIKKRYDTLHDENKFMKAMHFHTKDNVSLLRMHQPLKYGDDLTNFRPIIAAVNDEKVAKSGLEVGFYGIFYRVIKPIFDSEDQHIGSLGFGIELNYFADMLESFYGDKKFAYIFTDDSMALFKEKDKLELFAGQYMVSESPDFFKKISGDVSLKDYSEVKVDDKTYMVSPILDIKNYKGEHAATLLVAADVSPIISNIRKDIQVLIIYGIIIVIGAVLIVNTGFNVYIKKLNRANEQLIDAHKKILEFHKIVDKYVIFSETDVNGVITYASDAFSEVSQYSKEELVGSPHKIVRHPEMPPEIYKDLWNKISSGKVWNGQFMNMKKDGSTYWVSAVISPKFDETGKIKGYSAIREDITDKKRVEEMTITDELTNIYNRRYFNIVMKDELRRAQRHHTPITLAIMDIDFFKTYNDTYGHLAGDNALAEVGKLLKETLKRPGEYAFRVGGEEFAIISTNNPPTKERVFMESIREKIEQLNIEHKASPIGHLTCSIGVFCGHPEEGSLPRDIYKYADEALYDAKDSGRNRVEFFKSS